MPELDTHEEPQETSLSPEQKTDDSKPLETAKRTAWGNFLTMIPFFIGLIIFQAMRSPVEMRVGIILVGVLVTSFLGFVFWAASGHKTRKPDGNNDENH